MIFRPARLWLALFPVVWLMAGASKGDNSAQSRNPVCTSQFVVTTFIANANQDLTADNKILAIEQPSSVYVRGLHDWECRGRVRFADGTGYWALFGHHPHSSTDYEVFLDEE